MNMKPFSLSLSAWVFRLYLMMAVIIFAGFTGAWWLALLAVPIFASALMGVSISFKGKKQATEKVVNLNSSGQIQKKAS